MDLSPAMKDLIVTIGNAYWNQGYTHATGRALRRRGLTTRRLSNQDYTIGLTEQGMATYWTIREERAKGE